MTDQIQVEWEISLKCNYRCNYCTNLDKTINTNLDKAVIRDFIKGLGEKYPGTEIFVFGGEPFIHPHIEYIIKCFTEFAIPFVIQTNFSKHSVDIMKRISEPFAINISIHPTEVKLEQLPALFDTQVDIKTVDIMYTGREAIDYYFEVTHLLPDHTNVFLTPITDFGDGVSDTCLTEYNELRRHQIFSKIIQFEQVKRMDKYRSEVWLDPAFSTKGKPCLYAGKYFLYGPNLELYNCCYRVKTDGNCHHNKCFLM